jgi:hypothetical protein
LLQKAANRKFDQRATLGDPFSALTGTNVSTNLSKQQRDDNQGGRRNVVRSIAVRHPEELSLLGQALAANAAA